MSEKPSDEHRAADDARMRLEPVDDPGASRATVVAGVLLLLVIAWFASGFLLPGGAPVQPAETDRQAPITVAVIDSTAQAVTDTFVAEGQALADRDTIIRAETSGDIVEVSVDKGDDVVAGQALGRFVSSLQDSELKRARIAVERAEQQFLNAEILLDRGSATQERAEDARAALAAAEAQLAAAQQAVDSTLILAPFDGRIEDLAIDRGEYFSAGAELARIVDLEPLTIRARVPQQSLRRLSDGQTATVHFITGEVREGTVSFVGTSADPETRTFLLEVEIANDDFAIPAGISAEITIPTGESAAHFVSPAILALGENGTLGVKTVGDDNTVVFMEASILRADSDGIWIAGLPDTARIIAIGQGFVRPGDRVDPQPADALLPAAPPTGASR